MDVTWQVEEILVENESLTFSAVEPVKIQFDSGGGANLWLYNWAIFYNATYSPLGGQYQLAPRETAGQDLEDEALHQLITVTEAFVATNKYAMEGEYLTLTGDGVEMRLVRVPAYIPTPSSEMMQGTHGVTMNITNGVEGLVIDVGSETGIGTADVVVPTVGAATSIKLRLRLRGLEGWRFTFDNISTVGSVSTGDGVVSQEWQIGDASGTPIDESSPYWMHVTHVPDPLEASGYFELALPPAFVESGLNTFAISFVDFYR